MNCTVCDRVMYVEDDNVCLSCGTIRPTSIQSKKIDEWKKIIKHHILDARKMVSSNNEWIKGNRPSLPGFYEVTIICRDIGGAKKTELDYYCSISMEWYLWLSDYVIAYKPFKPNISSPYKEPERELRCPFCDTELKITQYTGVKKIECDRPMNGDNCYFSIKSEDEFHEQIKEVVFNLYDKLNPVTE